MLPVGRLSVAVEAARVVAGVYGFTVGPWDLSAEHRRDLGISEC
jgi:hypothetical protein